MESILEVRKISKVYQQEKRTFLALDNVSLEIKRGELCGIIGLSGAGKSTLIRILAGLVIPSSGEIFFQGKNVTLFNQSEKRRFYQSIGMVFQHFNLLSSRTVAENIAYPLEIVGIPLIDQKARIEKLLELVGLEGKSGSYPSQLSGGEKQRVGIARALANNPTLLLCDEATSALDPKTTGEILSLLKKINQELGVTIVLITHEMEVIKRICQKVIVMEKGKIIEQGSILDVFSQPQTVMTKRLVDNTSHVIPSEFFRPTSPDLKLLRLKFRGKTTQEPVMSEMVRQFSVNTNILQGWIDRIENCSIGTLVIELTGDPINIQKSLDYLKLKSVDCEVLENGL